MRTRRLRFLSVVLGVFLALGAAQILLAAGATAGVLYVAPAAAGAGTCAGWADACALQTALGAAVEPDQIWVQAGVHVPGALRTDSFALKTGVAVYGGFAGTETALGERDPAANVTILSGDIDGNDSNGDGNFIAETFGHIAGANSYHVLVGGGTTSTAVLDGFVVTAGQGNGGFPNNGGGGMDIRSGHPALSNIRFSGNYGGSGGGAVYTYLSNPTLTDVIFSGNYAGYGGGAYIENGSPAFTRVGFANNTSFYGGGMYTYGDGNATLVDCDFIGNWGDTRGGGMYNDRNSHPSLLRVRFLGNTGGTGAGMMNWDRSNPSLVNVLFSGNSATGNGGGLANDWSSPTLTNVTFSGNAAVEGGGVYNRSGSNPVLTNCLLWGNTASSSGSQIRNFDGADMPIIASSDLQGCGGSGAGWDPLLGSDGGGNIDADPLFLDAAGVDDVAGSPDDDLRLPGGSPAVNAGANAAVPAGVVTDLAGRPRISGDRVDAGAHEFQFSKLTFRSQGGGDGWIIESSEGSSAGGTATVGGATFNVGDDVTDRQSRAILSFNTAGLHDAAVVTRVTLRVKVQGVGAGGTNPYTTHGTLLVDVRKGYFGAAAGLQAADFQAGASRNAAGSLPKLAVGGWQTKVWKSGILPHVNNTGLTQMRLRFARDDNDDQNGDYLKVYSGEAGLAVRPQVIVEYYVPQP